MMKRFDNTASIINTSISIKNHQSSIINHQSKNKRSCFDPLPSFGGADFFGSACFIGSFAALRKTCWAWALKYLSGILFALKVLHRRLVMSQRSVDNHTSQATRIFFRPSSRADALSCRSAAQTTTQARQPGFSFARAPEPTPCHVAAQRRQPHKPNQSKYPWPEDS